MLWDYRAWCARKLHVLRLHCVGLICVRRRIKHKALPLPSPAWLQPPQTLYPPLHLRRKTVFPLPPAIPFALSTHSWRGWFPQPLPLRSRTRPPLATWFSPRPETVQKNTTICDIHPTPLTPRRPKQNYSRVMNETGTGYQPLRPGLPARAWEGFQVNSLGTSPWFVKMADFGKCRKSSETPWNVDYMLPNVFVTSRGAVGEEYGWIPKGPKSVIEQKFHGFQDGGFWEAYMLGN